MKLAATQNKTKNVGLERLNAKLPDRPLRKSSDAEQRIIDRIRYDDGYVADAVRALYSEQTTQEQATRTTIEKNGVGLSAWDARRFSKNG